MTDSPKDELEKLQKLRSELESRLAAIDEEQKNVEENVKILREKVAIQELERKMKEKSDSFAHLRIEKKELEDKLKEPNRLSMSEATLKAKEEIENKKDTLEAEKEEHSRVIWKKDEQTPGSNEAPEEQEKKKNQDSFRETPARTHRESV